LEVGIFNLVKFSGKCHDLLLFFQLCIPHILFEQCFVLVECQCHERFRLDVTAIVVCISFLFDVTNELTVTCALVSLEWVDHEVIAAFTTSLETFPVDLDVLVELFDVAPFNSQHVSIEAREVLMEETGSCTGIDYSFLHEKVEEKCSTCMAVFALTDMILVLFGQDLDAPFFGK
jgi:hypothetical protein